MFSLLLLQVIQCTIGQKPGQMTENEGLKMPYEVCTSEGNCQKKATTVTLDSNWRWIHDASGSNCYDGNEWDEAKCPDSATCTENCLLEGVSESDWESPYGVTADGRGSLTLRFVTEGQYSTNIGSRMYLLEEGGKNYEMFKLKNKEFAMDVDSSQLPCGLNGAVYFVEMDKDGGMHYPTNKAGAPYGTGYCDAQCPHDLKWIQGEANTEDWTPSDNDVNSGKGHYGACCFELDIWEANSQGTAFTNHPCDAKVVGEYTCEDLECGDNEGDHRYEGVCDKDGCDYNSWRQGDQTFYGPGSSFAVDSSKPLTYVTQFITDDGTDNGNLVEIRRVYVQNGKVISNSQTNLPGMENWDSITDDMCAEQKVVFGDADDHAEKGGLQRMGDSMDRGHVLVMSLWDDHDASMLWLDGNYPLDKDPSEPGVSRGPCPDDSGDPQDMENNFPDSTVKYFNIKIGPIGSTYPGGTPATTSAPPTEPTIGPQTTADHSCPGGDVSGCIALCPEEDPVIYQNCVHECIANCA